jgi:hypothetical protein
MIHGNRIKLFVAYSYHDHHQFTEETPCVQDPENELSHKESGNLWKPKCYKLKFSITLPNCPEFFLDSA